MNNLIPPEGATEDQLESFLESIRRDGRLEVRRLLLAGAPEAEVAAYIASLGPEPEDAIPAPEGEAILTRGRRPEPDPRDVPKDRQ